MLGVCNGTAVHLLLNGVLGDERPDGGNVLTSKVLEDLPAHDCQAHRVGGTVDHVHILCGLARTIAVSKLLEEVKTSSSSG